MIASSAAAGTARGVAVRGTAASHEHRTEASSKWEWYISLTKRSLSIIGHATPVTFLSPYKRNNLSFRKDQVFSDVRTSAPPHNSADRNKNEQASGGGARGAGRRRDAAATSRGRELRRRAATRLRQLRFRVNQGLQHGTRP